MLETHVSKEEALRLHGNSKQAQRSQYPILLLMILYTVSSLWIISQPIIEEDTATVSQGEKVMIEQPDRPYAG